MLGLKNRHNNGKDLGSPEKEMPAMAENQPQSSGRSKNSEIPDYNGIFSEHAKGLPDKEPEIILYISYKLSELDGTVRSKVHKAINNFGKSFGVSNLTHSTLGSVDAVYLSYSRNDSGDEEAKTDSEIFPLAVACSMAKERERINSLLKSKDKNFSNIVAENLPFVAGLLLKIENGKDYLPKHLSEDALKEPKFKNLKEAGLMSRLMQFKPVSYDARPSKTFDSEGFGWYIKKLKEFQNGQAQPLGSLSLKEELLKLNIMSLSKSDKNEARLDTALSDFRDLPETFYAGFTKGLLLYTQKCFDLTDSRRSDLAEAITQMLGSKDALKAYADLASFMHETLASKLEQENIFGDFTFNFLEHGVLMTNKKLDSKGDYSLKFFNESFNENASNMLGYYKKAYWHYIKAQDISFAGKAIENKILGGRLHDAISEMPYVVSFETHNKNVLGYYNNYIICIKPENWDERIVAHEVFHSVIGNWFKHESEMPSLLFSAFNEGLAELWAKTFDKDDSLFSHNAGARISELINLDLNYYNSSNSLLDGYVKQFNRIYEILMEASTNSAYRRMGSLVLKSLKSEISKDPNSLEADYLRDPHVVGSIFALISYAANKGKKKQTFRKFMNSSIEETVQAMADFVAGDKYNLLLKVQSAAESIKAQNKAK